MEKRKEVSNTPVEGEEHKNLRGKRRQYARAVIDRYRARKIRNMTMAPKEDNKSSDPTLISAHQELKSYRLHMNSLGAEKKWPKSAKHLNARTANDFNLLIRPSIRR